MISDTQSCTILALAPFRETSFFSSNQRHPQWPFFSTRERIMALLPTGWERMYYSATMLKEKSSPQWFSGAKYSPNKLGWEGSPCFSHMQDCPLLNLYGPPSSLIYTSCMEWHLVYPSVSGRWLRPEVLYLVHSIDGASMAFFGTLSHLLTEIIIITVLLITSWSCPFFGRR